MINIFAIFGLSASATALVIILLALILLFEIWMLVHVVQNEGIPNNTKVLWVVGMFLIHPFVAIGYLLTDYKKAGQ